MKRHSQGFTLIEVIVVIAVVSMIMPAIFSVIFAILQQEIKIYRLSEVKRQGDYALSIMESTIRDSATTINDSPTGGAEVCVNAGDSASADFFRDTYGNWFRFYVSNNKIVSNSAILNATGDITKSSVDITNFTVTCSRPNSASPALVNIQFTVSAGGSSSREEEKAVLNYGTKIKLRNY